MARGKYKNQSEAARARETALRSAESLQHRLDTAVTSAQRSAEEYERRIALMTEQISSLREQIKEGASAELTKANQQIIELLDEREVLRKRDARRDRQFGRAFDKLCGFFIEKHGLTPQESMEAAMYLLEGTQAIVVTSGHDGSRKDLHARALMDQASGRRNDQSSAAERLFGPDERGKALKDLCRMHEDHIRSWSATDKRRSREQFWEALSKLEVYADEQSYTQEYVDRISESEDTAFS